jgi:UDP-glucose 4-epimerase
MKVLVIGGCGFIGSHIVDQLLASGYSVRAFDRYPERFRAPLTQVEYVFGDIKDPMAIIEAFADVGVVMHLVSTTVPGTADLDPRADVRDNLLSTLSLLDSMVKFGVSRFVYLSSGGTVYGIPEQVPTPETHPLRPINSYGIVKTAVEHYINLFHRTGGISPIIIRASNPFGPRQGHTGVQGVVTTFLNRVLRKKPMEIWGDGSVVRDYLYVEDLARLSVTAAASDKTGAYNGVAGKERP